MKRLTLVSMLILGLALLITPSAAFAQSRGVIRINSTMHNHANYHGYGHYPYSGGSHHYGYGFYSPYAVAAYNPYAYYSAYAVPAYYPYLVYPTYPPLYPNYYASYSYPNFSYSYSSPSLAPYQGYYPGY